MAGTAESDVAEVSAAGGGSCPARLGHEPALDGLRGLAVVGVLVFHGGYLQGGYLGVDAFFVLSGFLITSLLLVEATGSGGVSLGRFWARRARRLLPALACVLGFVALYAAVWAQPNELATIRGDAIATLLYVANWHQIATSNDYFALFRSPSPLDHTWSLAIEEQFYVVWPLVIWLVVRARRGSNLARPCAGRVLRVGGRVGGVGANRVSLVGRDACVLRDGYAGGGDLVRCGVGGVVGVARSVVGPAGAAVARGCGRRGVRGRRCGVGGAAGDVAGALRGRAGVVRAGRDCGDRGRGASRTRVGIPCLVVAAAAGPRSDQLRDLSVALAAVRGARRRPGAPQRLAAVRCAGRGHARGRDHLRTT